MNVSKAMHTDQRIKSTDVFYVVKMPEVDETHGHKLWKDAQKWCRKNCADTWAFSIPAKHWGNQGPGKRPGYNLVSYFAFKNREDLLCFRLTRDDLILQPTWHTGTRFTIIEYTYS